MPSRWLFQYSPVKARSVPLRRVSLNCSGVSRLRPCSSVFTTLLSPLSMPSHSDPTPHCYGATRPHQQQQTTLGPHGFLAVAGTGCSAVASRPAAAGGAARRQAGVAATQGKGGGAFGARPGRDAPLLVEPAALAAR